MGGGWKKGGKGGGGALGTGLLVGRSVVGLEACMRTLNNAVEAYRPWTRPLLHATHRPGSCQWQRGLVGVSTRLPCRPPCRHCRTNSGPRLLTRGGGGENEEVVGDGGAGGDGAGQPGGVAVRLGRCASPGRRARGVSLTASEACKYIHTPMRLQVPQPELPWQAHTTSHAFPAPCWAPCTRSPAK